MTSVFSLFSVIMEGKTNFLDRVSQNRTLTHILFWVIVVLIAPITSDDTITEIREAFIFRIVALPIKMIATYFFIYYQIPKFWQRKKYFKFTFSFILTAVVFSILYRINNIYVAETLAGSTAPKESIGQIIYEFEYTFFGYFFRVYYYTILFIIVKTFKDHSVKKRQIEILEKEKTVTELNYLKAQIHPHFLFNTLNNLYALTLDKSDHAPEVVAKLSEMLDYMLYQCNEPKVLVRKEIELLNHYVDLEKLRYGDRLQLTFESNIDDSQVVIAPLILISIIENAFKHGVSSIVESAIVKISLEVKQNILYFNVFNTKASVPQSDEMDYKKGIGVSNIKRQLELVYTNQYDLDIIEESKSYQVNLKIKL
ncbi:sensor histidine kinase [Aquimarina sp. AU474]|uniref:sensor histidine kinase n=1 Tax=Aquimarina sp. AU474 TaxID=2108529 RepID=UPI000D69F021|nr:histidine kinase [Aquimarina sp. AU474]